IWLLSKTTNGVLRLMGINPDEDTENVSESQIRMMVDIGEEKGAIESTERDLIENIFEFNNVTAFDAMIHRTDMVVIYEEDTDEEILKTIKESGLSRFPVCGEDVDDILGILRTREYLINSLAENPKPLRDIIAPAYFVPETVKADVLFRDMQAKKVQFAIVLDEFGGTSGLITMEDLVEEVFGNIYDEFDLHEDLPLEKIGDNLWRAAGTLELETLFEELEMPYEESEDYSTLGGLVFSQFSVIPADGTNPETDVMGLHIRVEELREHRIEWTTISKLPDPDEEKDARERLDDLLNK
ncbi:MAG: HlyC/CorC family transporter, partial [Christensenellaceae bacterium]|nr:HlyC/CorC family transporter [Christensenellaceae bacterium]